MTVFTEDNDLEGQSVYFSKGNEVPKLPKSHLELLGPEELKMLQDVPGYFKALANKTAFPPLRRWLKLLADCDEWQMELHQSTKFPGSNQALIRFFPSDEATPAVRLARSTPPTTLPPLLQDIYSVLNGTNHCGFGTAGYLHSVQEISSFGTDGPWLAEENRIDPDTCMMFYTALNGDMLGYQLPDTAVWYRHERGLLQQASTLTEVLQEFFTQLCEGKLPDGEE